MSNKWADYNNFENINKKEIIDELHNDEELKPFLLTESQYEENIEKSINYFSIDLKKPLFVSAPMVNQSFISFRLIARKYGTDLCYTPMIHSRNYIEQIAYRKNNFSTNQEDSPLIAQICGNDPDIASKCCNMLRDEWKVNNIDINCGCPQNIAKRGNYGAYLLEQEKLVASVVRRLYDEGFNVSVKVRLRQNFRNSIRFLLMLERCGCKLITVHGRRVQDKKQATQECNFYAIKKLREYVRLPMIANGGVSGIKEAIKILIYTKCNSIMSSEGVLEYPAIFKCNKDYKDIKEFITKQKDNEFESYNDMENNPEIASFIADIDEYMYNIDDIVYEYLKIYEETKWEKIGIVKIHIFKFLYRAFMEYPDVREEFIKRYTLEDFKDTVLKVKNLRINKSNADKLGWYYRHWKKYGLEYYKVEEDTIEASCAAVNGYRDKQGQVEKDE